MSLPPLVPERIVFPETPMLTMLLCVVPGFLMVLGLVSHVVKSRLYLSEALLAILFGIALNAMQTHWFTVPNNDAPRPVHKYPSLILMGDVTREAARIVMALQIMTTAVWLPRHYFRTHWQNMLILLGPVTLSMWMTGTLITFLVCPELGLLKSMMLGACMAPTDPVLANSIVKGRFAEQRVPLHIRRLIAAESAANDAFALPLLSLPILLTLISDIRNAIGLWFYYIWLYQIFLSLAVGCCYGFIAYKAVKMAEDRSWIGYESFLCFTWLLALHIVGVQGLLGSNDLLAVLAAGLTFGLNNWYVETLDDLAPGGETSEAFQNVLDMVTNLGFFVYLGANVPWTLLWNPSTMPGAGPLDTWRIVVVGILVLLLRRLPILLACRPWMKDVSMKEALFLGWFGPMGVGCLFYSCVVDALIVRDAANTDVLQNAYLSLIPLTVVLLSTLVHGMTVPLFHLTMITRTLSLDVTRHLSLPLTGGDQEQQSLFSRIRAWIQLKYHFQPAPEYEYLIDPTPIHVRAAIHTHANDITHTDS